jgi:hypothetical protein
MAPREEADRAALLEERARVLREIAERTRGDASAFPQTPHDITDLPVDDSGDAAETLEENERNQEIVAVLRERLDEIDAALRHPAT